jgi:hypothetical protein
MRSLRALLLAVATATVAAVPAIAAPIAQYLPSGDPAGSFMNITRGQNFLVQVALSSDVMVTGFDLFSPYETYDLNRRVPVTFKVRLDESGLPAASNLHTVVDLLDRAEGSGNMFSLGTDFDGLFLAAGTYWFGLSGGDDIGWSAFGPSRDTRTQAVLFDENVALLMPTGNLAFRLLGQEVNRVPEPASALLVLLGLGAAGRFATKRKGGFAN